MTITTTIGLYSVILACFNLIYCQMDANGPIMPKSLISTFNRNKTLLLKLNAEALLDAPKFDFGGGGESLTNKWLFRQDPNDTPKIIYTANKLTDQMRYTCRPNNDNCDSLGIAQFGLNDIGEYARSGASSDFTKIVIANYYVSAYEDPIVVKCYSAQATCTYNASSNSLHVRENDLVTLTCAASIWRTSSNTGIPAEMFYKSQMPDQYECQMNPNRVITRQNTNSNTQNVELSKDCTRAFQRTDTTFNCGLKYTTAAGGAADNDIVVNTIGINLNVHYGPTRTVPFNPAELNRTVNHGTSIALRCPFDGYPIAYYWRVVSAMPSTTNPAEVYPQFNVGERDFVLPRSLPIGLYKYECKAFVDGFVRNSSDVVQFTVQVVDLRMAARKDQSLSDLSAIHMFTYSNIPAIIGGAVGGLVGLILVVFLVVYLIKCKRSHDDDIEKPKEQQQQQDPSVSPKSILRKPPPKDKKSTSKNSSDDLEEPLNGDSAARIQIPSENSCEYDRLLSSAKTGSVAETVYSPSVAESRRHDAAAPDANMSTKTSTMNSAYGSRTDLAIKAGGFKVLPTENQITITKKPNNPGESPPSYDAALQESPKTLPKTYQPQQHHYQSQTLLPKDFSGSSSKLPSHFGGSNTKLSTTSSQQPLYNPNGGTPSQMSNQHLNSQIEYSNVVNVNRARNRDPINSNGNLVEQQPQTQYSSVTHFTLPKPINV